MKNRKILLSTAILCSTFVFQLHAREEKSIISSGVKYSEQEKQDIIDEQVKKFAKEKHGELITVEQKDEQYDDYLKGQQDVYDPLERFNRVIHTFNGILDMLILEPLAYAYREMFPSIMQSGVSNFCSNIYSPLHCVNHILQGNMDDFFKTSAAFVVNTLFGGLGLFDMAEGMGLKRKSATFDQSLASFGMEAGPYLVLPIFGATSFRGAFGIGGDFMMDPMSAVVANSTRSHNHHLQQKNLYLAVWGIDIVDKRKKAIPFIEEVKLQPDPYIAIRSAVNQQRLKMEEELKNRP